MLTVKKAKLEKVIKSIDRKRDILTLGCEWAECNYVCKDTDSFLVHISHHIDELLIQESVTGSAKDAGKHTLWMLLLYVPCVIDTLLFAKWN